MRIGKDSLVSRRALAALILAAVIALTGARCGGGGEVHTQNWWINNPQYQGQYMVFGPKAPPGQWEEVAKKVRGQPGVRVWVQK